jgi:hypothetical protein
MKSVRGSLIRVLLLGALAGFSASLAAQADREVTSPTDAKTHKEWRETMHHTRAPHEGCFHASYPSTQWKAVQCAPPPGWRSTPRRGPSDQAVGNGADLVVQAPTGQLFSNAIGSFPLVSGVTSETGVGTAAGNYGGILGANEYSLQLNTNQSYSAACGSNSSCKAWQQYLFATNTCPSLVSCSTYTNETQVFIEYWLLDYGPTCPTGWASDGANDCVQNSPATTIYSGQLPITDLSQLSLSGSATASGTDEATVTFDGEAYQATVADSYTDIASVWSEAEFNVVGNDNRSQAEFNPGASIIVNIQVTDGSSSAPTYVNNAGTTGESNNLSLVPSNTAPVVCTFGGASPGMVFMESNTTPAAATCSYLEHPYAWLSAVLQLLQ